MTDISFICSMMFMFLCLLPLLFHPSAASDCHGDDRAALLELRQSLQEDAAYCSQGSSSNDYRMLESWSEASESGSSNCCTWDGVECDELTGRVIGLDLNSSCLLGSINETSSLFRLVHLQSLNLAYNDFNQSSMPSAIGSLSGLRVLNLSSCNLQGQIPQEILGLTNLSSIDMSWNSGLVLKKPNLEDLARSLDQLQELNLGSVDISGPVDVLINLTSLRLVGLSGCNLQGILPAALLELPQLTYFDAGGNQNLSGPLPELGKISSLKTLLLRMTNLSGELPPSLDKFASLTWLDMSYCGFGGMISPSISTWTNISRLNLAGNKFKSKLDSFGNFSRLISLDLNDNKFTGEIPVSIGNFSQLTYLDLSNNQLMGQIPSFGNLSQLYYLDLRRNQLSGRIPSSIGNLSQLTLLDLGGNQLTGPVFNTVTNLKLLSYLDLSSNELNDSIPYEFGSLVDMVELDLSSNRFYGPIPSSLSQLHNLTLLQLNANNFSGELHLDLILGLPELYIFDLSSNELSVLPSRVANASSRRKWVVGLGSCNLQEFPAFLQGENELTWLDLSNNNLSGQIPGWFSSFGSLLTLNLSANSLTGFPPLPGFMNLTQLETLDLRFNKLQGSLPMAPESIQFYLLANNQLSGTLPSSLCDLGNIQVLDLSKNNLTDMIPKCFGNMSSTLTVISLRNNNMFGAIPELENTNCTLKMIDFSDNQISGPLPRSLAYCTELQVLSCENNRINDTFPDWLGSLANLSVLIFRSNRLHGEIAEPPTDNSTFPKLQIIDISENKFSGSLPFKYFESWNAMRVQNATEARTGSYIGESLMPNTWNDRATFVGIYDYSMTIVNKGLETAYVKILDYFTVVDMSSNGFSGEIPTSIGTLEGLHLLNLSNNVLTGSIPPSLKGLSNLEALDLSWNRLSGEIPQELTELTSLSFFNVSYNDLSGQVPLGRQFGTFSDSSYRGNEGLCGSPLAKMCAGPKEASSQSDEDSDSSWEFDWKIIMAGVVSGLIVGAVLGQGVTIERDNRFVKYFGRMYWRRVMKYEENGKRKNSTPEDHS